MKTYEDCKEDVAEKNNFRDWNDLYTNSTNFAGLDGVKFLSEYYKEAAILYGEAKYLQGVNECTEFNKKHPQNYKQ